MSKLVFNRDGGKTDEYGHLLGLSRLLVGEVIEGLLVAANGTPNMTVSVGIGTGMVPTGTAGTAYKYFIGLDAAESVSIATANASNPRNDLIVAYIDKAVAASQSFTNNSNNILKIVSVAGNPAATPADPSVAMIQAAIGSASNPYIVLARVVVGAGVTQINSGNITDLRILAQPIRVGSSAILDGSITNTKLANLAVNTDKIELSSLVAVAQATIQTTNTQSSGTAYTPVNLSTPVSITYNFVAGKKYLIKQFTSYLYMNAAGEIGVVIEHPETGVAIRGMTTQPSGFPVVNMFRYTPTTTATRTIQFKVAAGVTNTTIRTDWPLLEIWQVGH